MASPSYAPPRSGRTADSQNVQNATINSSWKKDDYNKNVNVKKRNVRSVRSVSVRKEKIKNAKNGKN